MSELDPFTQVYNTLWELLESRADLVALVKLRNRIKFSGKDADPIRDEVSTADLPEIMLVPTGTEPAIQNTTSSSMVLERYEIRITSGDQRVDRVLYPLKFMVLRAMANWETKLKALTWNTKQFVKLVRPTNIVSGLDETALNRGIKSWVAIWTCEVQMVFTTTDLQGS